MFDTLSEKFSSAFKQIQGKSKITEANIEETLKQVRTALLEADVNFKVVKSFVSAVKQKALGEKVLKGVNPGEQFVKIMHDELAALMGEEHLELPLNRPPVVPIVICGLNGAGKTTFSGKLCLYLKQKKNKDVYLIPADNYRPAAKDQLIKHAKSLGVDYFDSDLSKDPAQIIKAGMAEAKKLHKEVAIIDTAGRLQINEELMNQLATAIKPLDNPEVLLVADAMTGQQAVDVAQTFHQKVNLTGVVLSKMDSDARGGAALSIRQVTSLPIRFISTGEKMKDLEPFHPDRLAKRILDMGDVLTLVEKAEEAIDEKEAEKMMKKMQKNRFTINDFLKQMETIGKLGSMESIMKMIPGMGGMLRQVGDLSVAESEMKKMRVIASSMTQQEREDYKLLNGSRRQRVAKGSGRSVQEINDFVSKFEQMKKMMSGMMGMMKGGGMPGIPGMDQIPGMGGASKGFRQQPGMNSKKKRKGKGKGPFGGGFFS